MPASSLSVFQTLKKEFGPQHWWPAETPFEVIVGAILTQNTSWKNVVLAIDNLKKRKLLSFNKMRAVKPAILASLIRPAGFFNVKGKRLRNFLAFLGREYSGNLDKLFREPLPKLRARLLGVNGIGPETADSIILYAAKKPIFVVDAYTKRVFSRIGLVKNSASYEGIQSYFMARLPKRQSLFNEYHALVVEHAKRFCAKKPRCPQCPLRADCRYFSAN